MLALHLVALRMEARRGCCEVVIHAFSLVLQRQNRHAERIMRHSKLLRAVVLSGVVFEAMLGKICSSLEHQILWHDPRRRLKQHTVCHVLL